MMLFKEQMAYYRSHGCHRLSAARAMSWPLSPGTNKYIDETMPWVLVKEETTLGQLRSVMNHLAEALRLVAHLSRPFMTQAPAKIFKQWVWVTKWLELHAISLWGLPSRCNVAKGTPIFHAWMQKQK